MFTRVPISTPFAVGPVNAYLADRTVVDPGPDSEESWAELIEALEARGLTASDVEQVLVTHPHPDHFGLARRLQAEGARVVASTPAAEVLADFPGHLDYEQAYFTDFLVSCGLSPETAQAVTGLPEPYLQYAPSVDADRTVSAGDSLTVADTTLETIEAAGHAHGEVVFAFDVGADHHAIVGDQILPDITPNPLLQPPPEPEAPRPRMLPAYNASLESLATRDFDRVLPGHRGLIDEPTDRIEAILAAHEERSANVRELLADGPATPAEIMDGLFGDLPATEKFAGMSEAVGHLDVLEERGVVERADRGGLFVYSLTD